MATTIYHCFKNSIKYDTVYFLVHFFRTIKVFMSILNTFGGVFF